MRPDDFLFPVRVYWEDTDAGGIVFYANYLKYFERARTEWLRSFGISQQALRASARGMFVVTETNVRYLGPARLDDHLLVTAELSQCHRASLTMAQQIFRGHAQAGGVGVANVVDAAVLAPTLICAGTIRIAWVETDTLQPARIPPSLMKILCP